MKNCLLTLLAVSCLAILSAGDYYFPAVSPYLLDNVRPLDSKTFDEECGHLQADFESYLHGLVEENKRYDLGVEPLNNFIPEECIVRGNLFIPWDDGHNLGLVGIGTFTLLEAVPVIAGLLDASTNEIRYLDRIPFAGWNQPQNIAWTERQNLFLENRKTLADALFAPMEQRYKEEMLSSEAKTALMVVRQACAIHQKAKGSLEGFSPEKAIKDAKLAPEILTNWKFTVLGQPPDMFIATSTETLPLGADKQVWWNEQDKMYHGFGVDGATLDGD